MIFLSGIRYFEAGISTHTCTHNLSMLCSETDLEAMLILVLINGTLLNLWIVKIEASGMLSILLRTDLKNGRD